MYVDTASISNSILQSKIDKAVAHPRATPRPDPAEEAKMTPHPNNAVIAVSSPIFLQRDKQSTVQRLSEV